MTTNNQQFKFATKITDRLRPWHNRLEIILVLLAGIAVLVHVQAPGSLNWLLSSVLSLLSLLYFLSSFASTTDATPAARTLLTNYLAGFGSSIAVMGLLFSLENLPNGHTFLTIGAGTTLLAAILLLTVSRKNIEASQHNLQKIIRLFLLAIICLLILFMK